MGYRILEKNLNGLEVIEVQDRVTNEYFNVVPSYGGAINEVVLLGENKLISVHKNAQSLKEFEKVIIPLYSGMFLAPFTNRIKDGRYSFKEKKFNLPINDSEYHCALHGFLYKSPFFISYIDETKGNLILRSTFEGDSGYPFHIDFEHTYRLVKGKIEIMTIAHNKSGTEIPFGMGWHPYIDLGKKIDGLQLLIPGEEVYKLDKQLIPTGETEIKQTFKNLSIISDRFMNDCYHIQTDKTYIYDSHQDTKVFIEQQLGPQGYNYSMVFTPPDRDCLAIEPMTCAPNAFNNGNGTILLSNNEKIKLRFSIGLEK